MRLVVTSAVVCVLGLASSRASADDLRLAWDAPKECPSADDVRAAALKSAKGEAASETLEADARVERGERWRVTLRTRRAGVASAERQLEAASCEALAEATAVILALALMPGAGVEEPATEPATTAARAAPAPAAVEAPARERAAEAPKDERPKGPYDHALGLGASLATDGTTLPAVAAGGAAALAWTPGPARLEVSGSYFVAQSETAGGSAAGAALTLVVLGARGCWALARGPVELSPCLGVDVHLVGARGFGAARNFDESARWAAGTGGALLRVPVAPWLALRAQADAVVPLARPRFVVENEGTVHRPSAMGARGTIGAELLFL
ncbi:MAG: hypothetical protein KF819_23585 [Labilithrix sp.]|nr:hypothetical protein [Labilithrix sp.]